MFCPNCGNQIPDGAKFCASCGNSMAVAEAPAPVAEPPVVEAPKKKKKKGLLIGLIAGITAVAVAGCAIGGWFLLGNKETVYVCTEKKAYDKNGTLYSITSYEYDDAGRLLSLEQDMGENEPVWNDELGIYEYGAWSEPDGEIDSFYEYEYDKHGNMTRMEYQYSKDHDVNVEEWEYEYDKKQIESATIVTNPGSEFEGKGEYEYEYEDGNLTAVYGIGLDGEKNPALMAEYDSKGRITKSIHVMMEWTMVFEYEYDKKGNLIEATFSSAPGKGAVQDGLKPWKDANLQTTVEYTYDKNGRLVEVATTDAESEVTRTTEYNYEGNQLVEIELEDCGSYEFTYDGKKLVEGEYDGEKYTFDKNGNLIKTETEMDGGTTYCYKYKKMRLSKADARVYYQQLMQRNRLHPGQTYSISEFDWRTVAVPTHPEMLANPAYLAWRK